MAAYNRNGMRHRLSNFKSCQQICAFTRQIMMIQKSLELHCCNFCVQTNGQKHQCVNKQAADAGQVSSQVCEFRQKETPLTVEKELKDARRQHKATDTATVYMRRCGKVMESMLRQTYCEMRERHLVQEVRAQSSVTEDMNKIQKLSPPASNHPCLQSLESTFFPARRKKPKDLNELAYEAHNIPVQSSSLEERKEHIFSTKEVFYQKMHLKYQDPDAELVTRLARRYPDPRQLFENVVTPLAEAGGYCLLEPVLTMRLGGLYWRAALDLPLDLQPVSASHPDKDLAENGVYLKACQQLERHGLIWLSEDGQWQLMTCERVVTMLDTLAKYVDASYVTSRGRGVRIILNQIKTSCDNKDNSGCNMNVKSKSVKSNTSLRQFFTHEQRLNGENEEAATLNAITPSVFQDVESSPKSSEKTRRFLRESYESNVSFQKTSKEHLSSLDFKQKAATGADTDIPELVVSEIPVPGPKVHWQSTIHVGWPYPFTVKAQGVSLPAAQMVGYLMLASKFKSLGILAPSNSRVSDITLSRLMRLDVQSHWEDSMLSSACDEGVIHKFSPNAELYCDASFRGYGAYLMLDGVPKVSWLSSAWEDHDPDFHELIHAHRWTFDTTVAELYTTVTAVCSWKKKLRGRRLVCFSDNQTVVRLINTHQEKHIPPGRCVTSFDRLMSVFQTYLSRYSITAHAAWLDRDRNFLADLLSRGDSEAFQSCMPKASLKKTRAKRLSIPWLKYKI